MKNLNIQIIQRLLTTFLLPLITIGIIIVVTALVLVPQIGEYNKTTQLINDKTSELDQTNAKIATLNNIANQSYQKYHDIAFRSLPTEPDLLVGLSQVQEIAKSQGLQLNRISFGNITSETANNTDYQIKVELSGTFDQLKTFMSSINEAPRVMKIGVLELTNTKDPDIYQVVVNMSAYYSNAVVNTSVNQSISDLTTQELTLLAKLESQFQDLPIETLETDEVETRGRLDPFE